MFDNLSRVAERAVGSPIAFVVALGVVLAWAITGPLFDYSDTWQLVINTSTTIVTFLLVFLIQSTQSRDTAAINAKLDELIRVIGPARNELIRAEEASWQELETMRNEIGDGT